MISKISNAKVSRLPVTTAEQNPSRAERLDDLNFQNETSLTLPWIAVPGRPVKIHGRTGNCNLKYNIHELSSVEIHSGRNGKSQSVSFELSALLRVLLAGSSREKRCRKGRGPRTPRINIFMALKLNVSS